MHHFPFFSQCRKMKDCRLVVLTLLLVYRFLSNGAFAFNTSPSFKLSPRITSQSIVSATQCRHKNSVYFKDEVRCILSFSPSPLLSFVVHLRHNIRIDSLGLAISQISLYLV